MQGQIEGYLIAVQGATAHALKVTIQRITRGEIDGISRRYCPTAPELSAAIRDEMADVAKKIDLEKNRFAIEDNRPRAVERLNILDRVNGIKARLKSEGRALLVRFDSFDAFNQYARRNILPKGFFYLPATAELYGAPGSAYDETIDVQEKEVAFVSDSFLREHYDTSAEAAMARLKSAAQENGKEFNPDALKSAPPSTFKQVGRAA